MTDIPETPRISGPHEGRAASKKLKTLAGRQRWRAWRRIDPVECVAGGDSTGLAVLRWVVAPGSPS